MTTQTTIQFADPPIGHGDTYRVSTWDHEADDWEVEYEGLSLWEVRLALRNLYGCGWTQMSMQVKAETHDRDAARYSRVGWMASTEIPKSIRRRMKLQEVV